MHGAPVPRSPLLVSVLVPLLALPACIVDTLADKQQGDTASEADEVEDLGDALAPRFEHLPVLRIDTAELIHEGDKVDATLVVIADHDGTLADLDAWTPSLTTPIGVELHGTSSVTQPKLGYRFECRDTAGEDTNCPLLGLPAGSDWVLHAPYADKTYMRNALAYGIGRAVATPAGRWEPRAQHVELLLNGQYEGIYLLVERVSGEGDRLDLPDTTDPVTGVVNGGFVLKLDQARGRGFDTALGTRLDWVIPKADDVLPPVNTYLSGWLNGMEAALDGAGFADPAYGYAAWIDVDAWIDHWLVNELAANVDAYRLSAYIHAAGPRGESKLRAGPLWDFDRGFGGTGDCAAHETAGWVADTATECGWGAELPFWWARLREDPAYERRLRTRWADLRAGALHDDTLRARIAALREATAEAEVRDHARWPIIGERVPPSIFVGETWEEDVAWFEAWVVDRAAWMDEALRVD